MHHKRMLHFSLMHVTSYLCDCRIVCRRRVRVEHALPYGEKRFPNREPARRSSWSTPAKPAYRYLQYTVAPRAVAVLYLSSQYKIWGTVVSGQWIHTFFHTYNTNTNIGILCTRKN